MKKRLPYRGSLRYSSTWEIQQPAASPLACLPHSSRLAGVSEMRSARSRRLLAVAAAITSAWVLLDAFAIARGEVPADPAARERIVGNPVALTVTPSSITLLDERDWAQLVVTGNYADGTVRDLTPFCDLACAPADLVTIDAGCLIPARLAPDDCWLRREAAN